MKLIIDIPESTLILLKESGVDWLDAECILSAVAEGVSVPEREKGTDADIIECARAIKKYCELQPTCRECRFKKENGTEHICAIYECPNEWNLPEGDKE